MGFNRMKEEIAHMKKIESEPVFFTPEEISTLTQLGDIIIPKDEFSGSASDAQVPAFLEFIVKDKPEHQTPLRGGLRWLDVQCLNRYGNGFKDCSPDRQMEMVDRIAWPAKAKPEMLPGVAFFNLLRNLVAPDFSEMGERYRLYWQCSISVEWCTCGCIETIQPGLYRKRAEGMYQLLLKLIFQWVYIISLFA